MAWAVYYWRHHIEEREEWETESEAQRFADWLQGNSAGLVTGVVEVVE